LTDAVKNNYWETTALSDMTQAQWEQLCDGCGLCCLVKLEDEDTGKVLNTSVCCQFLNIETCQCDDYKNRFKVAPMCTQLTLNNLSQMNWLPESCAYKRLANNQPLPEWHYLLSGEKGAVHVVGVSAKCFAQSEEYIHSEQLVDFVIELKK